MPEEALSERLDREIGAMRERASNLIGWYTNPPSASEMLGLLDLVEHQLYVARSSGQT